VVISISGVISLLTGHQESISSGSPIGNGITPAGQRPEARAMMVTVAFSFILRMTPPLQIWLI
jgi:hypothetical protein